MYAKRRSKARTGRKLRVLRRSVNRRVDPEAGRKKAKLILWLISRIAGTFVMFCVFVAAGLFVQDRYRLLVHSDTFALEELLIEGNKHLNRDMIIDELGLSDKIPLLTLDLDVLETRLELMPWVKKAEIRRKLPHNLEIRIQERCPVAIVALERLYLVDEGGDIFKRYTRKDKEILLPLITGIVRDEFADSPEKGKKRLKKALSLLLKIQAAGIDASVISEINLPDYGSGVLVMADGLRVHLPEQDMEKAVKRLRLVLADLEKRSWHAREIFLDNRVDPQEVTVRLAHDRGRIPGATY